MCNYRATFSAGRRHHYTDFIQLSPAAITCHIQSFKKKIKKSSPKNAKQVTTSLLWKTSCVLLKEAGTDLMQAVVPVKDAVWALSTLTWSHWIFETLTELLLVLWVTFTERGDTSPRSHPIAGCCSGAPRTRRHAPPTAFSPISTFLSLFFLIYHSFRLPNFTQHNQFHPDREVLLPSPT